jgi:hypothetical protein
MGCGRLRKTIEATVEEEKDISVAREYEYDASFKALSKIPVVCR